jgi:hypothetical protein
MTSSLCSLNRLRHPLATLLDDPPQTEERELVVAGDDTKGSAIAAANQSHVRSITGGGVGQTQTWPPINLGSSHRNGGEVWEILPTKSISGKQIAGFGDRWDGAGSTPDCQSVALIVGSQW